MITDEEFTEDERARYSIFGFMRFDAQAVASVLRSRSLSPREARGLARLIDGTHSRGMHLVMRGQGKGWQPIVEQANSHNRLMAIGRFVEAQLAKDCTVEGAVNDASTEFGVSEPTVYRYLKLYRRGREGGL